VNGNGMTRNRFGIGVVVDYLSGGLVNEGLTEQYRFHGFVVIQFTDDFNQFHGSFFVIEPVL